MNILYLQYVLQKSNLNFSLLRSGQIKRNGESISFRLPLPFHKVNFTKNNFFPYKSILFTLFLSNFFSSLEWRLFFNFALEFITITRCH